MTDEELDELRRFYAYRQKPFIRSILAERLKGARALLGAAQGIYNQYPTNTTAKYLEICQIRVKRYQERIEELDQIGVNIYVERSKYSKRIDSHRSFNGRGIRRDGMP